MPVNELLQLLSEKISFLEQTKEISESEGEKQYFDEKIKLCRNMLFSLMPVPNNREDE